MSDESPSALPRVDRFMSDEDLTAAAQLIQSTMDWSKVPELRSMFELLPCNHRLWHELVALTLHSLDVNHEAIAELNAAAGVEG